MTGDNAASYIVETRMEQKIVKKDHASFCLNSAQYSLPCFI
jgi:hypothetical protein